MATHLKTTAPRLKTMLSRVQISVNSGHTLYRRAFTEAFTKLDPRRQIRNPVMLVATAGSILTSISFILLLVGESSESPVAIAMVAGWLWFTVLLTNFAGSLAGGHSWARAETLRRARRPVTAKKLSNPKRKDEYESIPAATLRWGDVVLVEAGDILPADGEVIEGVALVDESILTGKNTPVAREAGGNRTTVTAGARVLSGWLVVRVRARPGEGLPDHIATLVTEAQHQPPPYKTFLRATLAGSVIISLLFVSGYGLQAGSVETFITITMLTALLVALSPMTTGGLLSVIDLTGLDRLIRRNIIPLRDQNAMEMAGQVDVLLLDKSAAIVPGYRMAAGLIALDKTGATQLAKAARLVSLADETPESKSIIALAEKQLASDGKTGDASLETPAGIRVVSPSDKTGLNGIDFNGNTIRKGSPATMITYLRAQGYPVPSQLNDVAKQITAQGGIPMVISLNGRAIGVIHLREIINARLEERLMRLRQMGIKTIMLSDDTPLAAASIAAAVGTDDFLTPAPPEARLALVRYYQALGQQVAITGHCASEASVLFEADVAMAMNTGPQPVRQAANLVDLDSNPAKLVELVEMGQQWLATRWALTTFSMISDVVKYAVLIPAIFAFTYPVLGMFNFMQLSSPVGAVLSTVIFNALTIVVLTPPALRGIPPCLIDTARWQSHNVLMTCGLGGLIAPFIGIKVIDLILVALGVV